MAQYAGAWKRAMVDQPKVRLKPPPDPAHGQPGTNPGQINWRSDTIVPSIPDEWLGDQYLQMPTILGVVDETPVDHGHGMGVGAGQDTHTAQDARTDWHGEELGATDARRYQPAPTREGTYNVRVLDDTAGNGYSPAMPAMRYESGVGIGSDPGARVGKRIFRWRERVIDMHRWDPEGRASVQRFAAAAANPAPQSNGNQYTSQSPMYAQFGQAGIGSPDQYMVPVARRSPRPWDESQTVEGINPGSAYGLTSWGL